MLLTSVTIVRTKDNIIQHMAMFRPGERISVGLGRTGDTMVVDVQLDTMEVPFKQRDRAATRKASFGAEVAFNGAVGSVSNVKRHGPSYHAGIQDGDVVVSINGQPIQSKADLTSLAVALKPGAAISVVVDRRGTRRTCDVIVGAMHQR